MIKLVVGYNRLVSPIIVAIILGLTVACGGGGASANNNGNPPAAVQPVVTTQPVDQSVAVGTVATFVVAANGQPTPTLQWERSTNGTTWTTLDGATTSTYSLAAQNSDNGAKFRAKASNSAGTATSNVATLIVNPGVPVAIKTPIAAGGDHSLSFKSDGTIWAWGDNSWGQLGSASNPLFSLTPIQVNGLTGALSIACGKGHSLAVKSGGTVWAWGHGSSGQLGDGTGLDHSTPIQVPGLTGVLAISAGWDFSLALKSDGTVWAWGNNGTGQLGDGTTLSHSAPVQVPGITNVVAIVAGGMFNSYALKSDGTVWGWGSNIVGQVGDGTNTQRNSPTQALGLSGVTSIAAGNSFAIALKSDGTVWSWGKNSDGQLGNGTTTNQNIPVKVPSLAGILSIAAGYDHGLAIKTGSTVLAWGIGIYGNLGDGTSTSRTTPVQVSTISGVTSIAGGQYHSLAVKNDGTVWVWGTGLGLGDGSNSVTRSSPVQVIGLSGVYPMANSGATLAPASQE